MSQPPRLLEQPPHWSADEQPTMPGSPALIAHSRMKRCCYFIIGLVVAISASLSNGFISANLPLIQAEYALSPSEAAWIPAVYVMANVSANLILFKARQQFGLRPYAELGLILFILVTALHLWVHSFQMALLVRFISGFVAAPLSSLGMYYVMQAFNRQHSGKGIYLALGFGQLGVPLAWIISPQLLEVNSWSVLYRFELGLAICCLAMVVALKLPRSMRIAVFEKKDLITFSLIASGFACLCVVLTQGPILWWLNAPQLAYYLVAGLGLLCLGLSFEHYRDNPLIMTRWLGSASVIQFIVAALLLRIVMSEQSYAATNFLKSMGMGPDQLVPLYSVIFIGIALGTLLSALLFSREKIIRHFLFAVMLIVIACGLDWHLTSQVRPQNFFLSQFLVGMASGAFIGPLLLSGMIKALQQGPQYIITFTVLFSATQNFGGLMGNAFFNSYQQQRSQYYQTEMLNQISPTQVLTQQQLHHNQMASRSLSLDPQFEQQLAMHSLKQNVQREAQVRAYSDVIAINGLLALFILIWGLLHISWQRYRQRAQSATHLSTVRSD